MGRVYAFILGIMVLPALAFAEDVAEVPIGDVLSKIFDLAKNAKGMNWLAISAAVIMICMQLLKTSLLKNWFENLSPIYKRLVLFFLTFVLVLVNSLGAGMSFGVAVAAAVTSVGGALAIYEVFKPFINLVIEKIGKKDKMEEKPADNPEAGKGA